MNRKYDNLTALINSLNGLFELCDIQPQDIAIKRSPKLVAFAEMVCRDTSVADLAGLLNEQTEKAIKTLNEKRIDNWCADQENRKYDEMEKQCENLRRQNEELRLRIGELTRESSKGVQAAQPVPENKSDPQTVEFVKELIAMRDKLYSRLEWAKSAYPEDDKTIKLLNTQISETAVMMRNLGISILDDTEIMDDSYCTVIETVPTDDPSLYHKIAEIFRPGYRYDGKVLRSKEVIIYSKPV